MRVLVASLAFLVIGALAIPFAAARQQEAPDHVQLFVVLDVSGSMGDYVFSEDLPQEILGLRTQIAGIEEQLEDIEAGPQVVALRDQLEQLENDPVVAAAQDAFDEANEALDDWITAEGVGDRLRDLHDAVRAGLRDIGCDEFLFANIVSSAAPGEVDQWIDFACGDITVSDDDRDAIHAIVPFIADPDYQTLNQDQRDAFVEVDAAREAIGINALEMQLFQLFEDLGLYDLSERLIEMDDDLEVLVEQQGFPIKLELAQLAAHTLLDLSRLGQVAGNVDTTLGLAVFSTEAELRHEMTQDLDAIADEIDVLIPLDRTNLGGGMTVALDELERLRNPEYPAAIILLSDGHSNEGMSIAQILDAIPRRAGELDTIICSAGFATTEDEVDADLLRGLAEETDGEYQFVTRGEELTSFFLACRQGLLGTVVERTTGVASAEPTEAGRIDVPSGSCTLTAVVAFVDEAPELRLIDPDGTEAVPAVQQDGNVRVMTVQNPAPGSWIAESVSSDGDLLFSLVLSAEDCAEPPAATTAVTTQAPGSETGGGGGGGLIIILVIVLLGGAGAAVFFFLRKRSSEEGRYG